MSEYKKAIVGGLGGLATWLATSLADNGITNAEWGCILLAILTGAGVYQAANAPAEDDGGTDLHGVALTVLVVAMAAIACLLFWRLATHAPTGL